MEHGTRHGRGRYTFGASGALYDGAYAAGARCGHGAARFPDGGSYTGAWVDDRMDGDGVHTYANGDVYAGGFLAGRKHGRGVYHCRARRGLWREGPRTGFACGHPRGRGCCRGARAQESVTRVTARCRGEARHTPPLACRAPLPPIPDAPRPTAASCAACGARVRWWRAPGCGATAAALPAASRPRARCARGPRRCGPMRGVRLVARGHGHRPARLLVCVDACCAAQTATHCPCVARPRADARTQAEGVHFFAGSGLAQEGRYSAGGDWEGRHVPPPPPTLQ